MTEPGIQPRWAASSSPQRQASVKRALLAFEELHVEHGMELDAIGCQAALAVAVVKEAYACHTHQRLPFTLRRVETVHQFLSQLRVALRTV